ncbi:MAG: TIGR03557 family F420-dependent LLM class oxidoreductase [Streptosporangiaceae bacterium]
MTNFGYTLKELVREVISAEKQGFDFEVCSDHFSPWLTAQGHAPNAWTVPGAVAHATERVDLYTYVTCPTMRYHPAVVAQQAARVQILSDGRFTLGLGSGENLNEHIVGKGWPTVKRRQDMPREAIKILRELFGGELVNWRGDYFQGCRPTAPRPYRSPPATGGMRDGSAGPDWWGNAGEVPQRAPAFARLN